MTIGRVLSWAIVALLGVVPINWLRLWINGEVPETATWTQFLIGTAVCWGFGGALGYFLTVSARGNRRIREREEQELEALLAAPLVEIQPGQALLKPDEKAFASVNASLLVAKTVGFEAATSGISIRVASGVSVRTSGTRGRPIKDLVNAAHGELVITDKRLIFSGDRKSFSISLARLLNVTNYTDGFRFSDNRTTYTVTTDDDRARRRFAVVLSKLVHR